MSNIIVENRIFRDRANVETFIAVAEMSNITKAAQVLGCSQPAISVRIRRLEQVLNSRLIIRRRGGLKLTKRGEELYALMKTFRSSLSHIEQEIEQIKEKHLSFTFGLSSILTDFILPHCIFGMHQRVEGDLYIKNDDYANVIDDVIDGKIDMAIVESNSKIDGLEYHAWFKDEIVLFSHTPLQQTFVPEALYGYVLLLYTDDAFMHKHIQDLFDHHKTQRVFLDVVGVIDNIISVKQAVLGYAIEEQRQLVSWSPRSAISDELASQRLYASSLGSSPIEHQFYVVYQKRRNDDPIIKNMLSHLQGVSKSLVAA